MATEQFSKIEFEDALQAILNSKGNQINYTIGFEKGEWVYYIDITQFTRLVIRSSVGSNNIAAGTGQDSIRVYLQVCGIMGKTKSWQGIKKLDAWTTRVSGWQRRMGDKMRELYKIGMGVKMGRNWCQKCNSLHGVWVAKSGGAEGKIVQKCFNCGEGFTVMNP